MKITVRLIVSLLVAASLVAATFSFFQVHNERTVLVRELDARAAVVAEGMEESARAYIEGNQQEKLQRLLDRLGNRTRLLGVAVFDSQGVEIAATKSFRSALTMTPSIIAESIVRMEPTSAIVEINGRSAHLFARPLVRMGHNNGLILLYHDASFIEDRLRGIWYANFLQLFMQFGLIIVTTILVVRWSITGPIAQAAGWMRGLRTGKPAPLPMMPRGDILSPLAREASLLAKSLSQARASAQQEARLRMQGEAIWTAERLKEHVRSELHEKNLFVVSNREPYMHMNAGSTTECVIPAGGLVTAIDPILRACGGVWVAHGSGNADRDHADLHGKLAVPPDDPAYTLHRVFLTKEEEEGYYYGFANEGIWPLCHITHTRPVFRLEDWKFYQEVNRKFADALIEDIKDEESPLVLIQDYHFALVPMLVKADRPDARVAIFWHIPWPNPEVFGICPWKEELLLGLLGADIVGFHTQFHCNNFLETVDRFLESKTNWDKFSVERNKQLTIVRSYPISVAYPSGADDAPFNPGHAGMDKVSLLKASGIQARFLGVGVDRIDYTKGILERFLAVERFLQLHPEFVGQFTFVELGAPSRTHIKRYHDLIAELDETADRVNWKFQTKTWKPILFLKAHHSHETINKYYRVADVCLVTSLHDGMNLVAKEFVATRSDADGVLILSQFAGAANELQDALIVNPYHTEEVAEAMYQALTMDSSERHARMEELRRIVRERNVFRWAANIITGLSHVRLQKPSPGTTP